jgi:hypothetical protein
MNLSNYGKGYMYMMYQDPSQWRCILHCMACCWEQAYFEEIPNFGARATSGKKTTCEKRRKNNMQEETSRGEEEGKLNHVRVRVFYKYCNEYNPIKYYK